MDDMKCTIVTTKNIQLCLSYYDLAHPLHKRGSILFNTIWRSVGKVFDPCVVTLAPYLGLVGDTRENGLHHDNHEAHTIWPLLSTKYEV